MSQLPPKEGVSYQSQEEFIPRRKRRARDDPMERNYICVCGKRYLSYPALYTHIKNKHQGKAPSPGDVSAIRPGSMMVTREEPQNEYEKNLSTPDEALVYVINTFKAYSGTKQLNYSVDELFGVFPQELRRELEEVTKAACNEKVQVEKVLDNGIKAVVIDKIFAKFLSLLVNKIDKALLEEFIFILLVFRKYLNLYFTKEAHKQYTKDTSGYRLPEYANQFALYHYDRLAASYKSIFEEGCFIGNKRREFICLTKFMFLFCRWAFLDRYTNTKIKLNNF